MPMFKNFLILTIFTILLSGCGQSQSTSNTASPAPSISSAPTTAAAQQATTNMIKAKVTKVVDGDTIEVQIGDKKETIRMLLIDTPETVHPDKPKQPFGPEASAFTKETLTGKEVKLEKDVTERDKYGRLLFYVWIGDKMYNELLLEKGLARVAVYPPDVKYIDQFRAVQKKAQEAAIGIWSIENYATDKGFNDNKAQPAATAKPVETSAPKATEAPTKAPAATKTPESNVYYSNCTEAKTAGAYNIKRGEPGYSSKLDRDGDGVACEK